jgi:hypothetical protein
MSDLLTKYQEQLDQAITLADKLNKQKSYLVDLLIKDKSQASNEIIDKYLNWLEENER